MTVLFQEMALSDLHLYEENPRDNEAAISAVMESIRQFGFLVPIVVGADNVIAAGHTRYEAARRLGIDNVPVIIASNLTEDQLRAFRLIDNKVSELATWDYDLLANEISALTESGIDLVPFGWSQQELDCLVDMVAEDCIDRTNFGDAELDPHNAGDRQWGKSAVTNNSKSVAFSLGEFRFFVDRPDYEEWAHLLRKKCGHDMETIINQLTKTIGITPQHKKKKVPTPTTTKKPARQRTRTTTSERAPDA